MYKWNLLIVGIQIRVECSEWVDSFATNCRFMKKERKRWETKGWIEERRRKTDELERRGWDEEGESSEIIQCEQQRIEPETESQWLELRGDKMVRA